MKIYTVKRGGVELTVQLSDEDAKRLGARPVKAEVPEADSAAEDAAAKDAAEAKAQEDAEAKAKEAAAVKAATPANKGRAPQDK